MNKKLFFLCCFVLICFSVFAESTRNRVIKTTYFDVIYPPESVESANLLAAYADGFAEEICRFLNTEMKERLPVYLDPRIQELNAYYTSYPYSRIYLYDTVPLEGSLAVFSDTLLKVFYHELTHAISLTIRTPFWQFMSEIFGDVVSVNQFLTMPLSFIEGVAVSFESLEDQNFSAAGRLNDSRMKEVLVQAKIEGLFPTWKEAAGARDLYPGAKNSYVYGGFFSQWLQKKYGMEAYARLWERGSGLHIFKNGIQGQFKAIYGTTIEKEWALFYESISIPSTLSPSPESINGTKEGLFTALASGKNGLVWFDSNEGAVYFRNLEGKTQRLFRAVHGVHRLSFSPDGKELLVSGYTNSGKTGFYEVRMYNIEKRKFTGESWRGYKDAAFAETSEQILVIQSESQNSHLVRISRSGSTTSQLVYTAGPGQNFSLIFNPVSFGSNKIAFIGVNGLERDLVWADSASLIDSASSSGIWLTHDLLPRLSHLSVSEKDGNSTLFFSYAGPQGLSRWASFNPVSNRLTLQSLDYSGILTFPVYQEETKSIFYIADYAEQRKIVSVSASEASVSALNINQLYLFPEQKSKAYPLSPYPSIPYNCLKWFTDGVFLPAIKIESNEKKDDMFSWGFSYTTMDPTESICFSVEPYLRLDPFFIDWTVSTIFDTSFCKLSFTGSDKIMPSLFIYTPYRRLHFGSTFAKNLYTWNRGHVVSGSIGFLFNGYSNDIFYEAEPYKASFSTFSSVYSTELYYSAISTTTLSAFPLFRVTSKGISAAFLSDFVHVNPESVYSGLFQSSINLKLPFIPLSCGISGAWGKGISFAPDTIGVSVLSAREFDTGVKRLVPSFIEYSKTAYSGYNSSIVGGCTVELDFLTLEIQKGIPVLPAYANRLIVTGGYRGAVFGYPEKDPLWLDSAYASASFQGAFLIGMLSTVVIEGKAGYAIPLRSGDPKPFFSLRIGVGL